MRVDRQSEDFETLSQTGSDKTGATDLVSLNSRSVNDAKQRRRRGDRSKGETKTRVKRVVPKPDEGNHQQVKIQPVLQAPVVNYEAYNCEKPLKKATEKQEPSKAVDFANMLLAKHEANMRQREKEGIYPSPVVEKKDKRVATTYNVNEF